MVCKHHARARNWKQRWERTHLVADEAESSQLGLEVPQHDAVVSAARGELLEGGAERKRRHIVPVPAERSLQGGICQVLHLQLSNVPCRHEQNSQIQINSRRHTIIGNLVKTSSV